MVVANDPLPSQREATTERLLSPRDTDQTPKGTAMTSLEDDGSSSAEGAACGLTASTDQDGGASLEGEIPCQDCGGFNPVWFAPSPDWNLVLGGPEAKGDPGGMLCPNCYIRRAEAAGLRPTAWFVSREVLANADTTRSSVTDPGRAK